MKAGGARGTVGHGRGWENQLTEVDGRKASSSGPAQEVHAATSAGRPAMCRERRVLCFPTVLVHEEVLPPPAAPAAAPLSASCLVPSLPVASCPGAWNKRPHTGWCEQQKFILPQFRRPELQDRSVGGLVPSEAAASTCSRPSSPPSGGLLCVFGVPQGDPWLPCTRRPLCAPCCRHGTGKSVCSHVG